MELAYPSLGVGQPPPAVDSSESILATLLGDVRAQLKAQAHQRGELLEAEVLAFTLGGTVAWQWLPTCGRYRVQVSVPVPDTVLQYRLVAADLGIESLQCIARHPDREAVPTLYRLCGLSVAVTCGGS